MLLGVLIPEITNQDESAVNENAAKNDAGKLTAVARRLLPSLRHYSSWLLTSCSGLLEQTDEIVTIEIKEFWKRYAEALTWLTTTFEVTELLPVDYLLEEDIDTVAFKPLILGPTTDRYRQSSGNIKHKSGDAHVQRLHPNDEMLARVRDLVKDGVQLILANVSIASLRRDCRS